MDKSRKAELKEQYKEVKIYLGAIKIVCNENGKVFVMGVPDTKNKWLTLKMQLNMGQFANAGLQADWKKHGENAFMYEVLEEVELDSKIIDKKWEVKSLEKKWLDILEPYGEKGYNTKKDY